MSEEDVVRLQEQVKTLFCDIKELKERDIKELSDEVKKIGNNLANRLPPWATAIIALLTGAVGWLVH